jgi:hypothetical protein
VAKAVVERLLKKQIEECSVQFEKYEAYDFHYTFIFGLSAKQDVSNFIKFIEDIIFNLFLCDDDSKVQRIIAEKFVCKGEYNVVIVTWKKNEKPGCEGRVYCLPFGGCASAFQREKNIGGVSSGVI